jgi:carboxypeptidase C (cathepsin A)
MKGLCILTLSVMLVAGAAFSQETAPKGVSAFNDYVRKALKYGDDKMYKSMISLAGTWNYQHQPPNFFRPLRQANVMADLAWAMKYNPNLKIQLNAGYFDLATPFYEGIYEMRQLPMPAKLQDNIEFKFYQSGHMVYVHESALKELHENVATFIRGTDHLPAD